MLDYCSDCAQVCAVAATYLSDATGNSGQNHGCVHGGADCGCDSGNFYGGSLCCTVQKIVENITINQQLEWEMWEGHQPISFVS